MAGSTKSQSFVKRALDILGLIATLALYTTLRMILGPLSLATSLLAMALLVPNALIVAPLRYWYEAPSSLTRATFLAYFFPPSISNFILGANLGPKECLRAHGVELGWSVLAALTMLSVGVGAALFGGALAGIGALAAYRVALVFVINAGALIVAATSPFDANEAQLQVEKAKVAESDMASDATPAESFPLTNRAWSPVRDTGLHIAEVVRRSCVNREARSMAPCLGRPKLVR